MDKDYIDVSKVENIKELTPEESRFVRDRDIKVDLTFRYCLISMIISILASGIFYFLKRDILMTAEMFIVANLLIFGTATDIKMHLIPNWLSLAIFSAGIPYAVKYLINVTYKMLLWHQAIGLFVGFILLFISAVITRGGIGTGDILIVTAAGFVFGPEKIFSGQMIGFLLAIIVGGTLILFKKIKKKTKIAFLPYLSAGIILANYLPDGLIFKFFN